MADLRESLWRRVSALFESHAIEYCLLNGSGEVPQSNDQDLDVLIGKSTQIGAVVALLRENQAPLQADIVSSKDGFCIFLCGGDYAPPQFLLLDLMQVNPTSSASLFPAEVILATCQKMGQSYVAAPAAAFCLSFAKAMARGKLGPDRKARLHALALMDLSGCSHALAKLMPPAQAAIIMNAAKNNQWHTVETHLPRPITRPQGTSLTRRLKQAASNFVNPPGFHIVMLGPDGAGKSSVVDTLEAAMTGPFSTVMVLGFAPPLYRLWRKGPVNTSTPHAAKPRSYGVSLLRGAFWLAYNLAGHLTLRLAKARNTLIVNDRHFIDILVDPVRYRYGGPRWLLQLIRAVMPKPDATVLLYGQPEVLQARKKELTVEETARQCADYLALVKGQEEGQIVDANQPFNDVMHDVLKIIFRKDRD